MPFIDVLSILQWWFLFLAIGLFFLPITTGVFSQFVDRGYIFSKILGMAVLSYLVFLLGTLHILPFTTQNVWIILIFLAICNLIFFRFTKFEKPFALSNGNLTIKFPKGSLLIIILEELLFALGIFFWAWVRGHEPSIHGLEKFMDFGFINSLLRADYFPPKDMWLPPFSINYYFFGHLVTAVLTKLSGIDSGITYNLMLATLFAFTFTGAFSIGLNLFNIFQGENQKDTPKTGFKKSSIFCGFLSAFLATFAGNLHPLYAFLKGIDNYWYPDATRFIPYTIHEFPIYSFVVADLHGHLLDVPFVLLTIALIFAFLVTPPKKILLIIYHLLLSLLLAVLYMTNAWDGLIYAGLTLLIFIYLATRSKNYTLSPPGRKLCLYAVRYLLILLGFFLFALPFSLNFKPFVSGVGIICAPQFLTKIGSLGPLLFEANHCDRSPFWMLAILWGFFYFLVFTFLLFLRKQKKSGNYNLLPTDYFILIISFLSTLLLLFPEIAYVKDIYPMHYRANTMFKLGYQAFIMLSLAGGYIILRILTSRRDKFFYWFALTFTTLFVFVAVYPYFAINSYYNGLKNYEGLNGLKWLDRFYPQDYRAILWLRENIQGQPVILEANGESYTDYARVSANTGLPTIIGWPVHEWLWRGSYDEAGKRIAEVQRIYESTDLLETTGLLEKYNVEYVFVGNLERQKYPGVNFEKWGKLGTLVFQYGQTQVFKILP